MTSIKFLRRRAWVAFILSGLVCPLALGQETVTLNPTKDNSLFSEDSSLSNGAGEYLFTGSTAAANNGALRRALLSFEDLSSIPGGVVIDAVELTVRLSKRRQGAADVSGVRLHRLLANWGEGTSDAIRQEGRGAAAVAPDATWTNRETGGSAWDSPGGDFDATASSTVEVDGLASYTFPSTPELIADIEFWVANPDQNFGWIMVMDDVVGNARRFNSREHENADNRPQLNITYTPTGEPEFPINFGHSGGWFNFDTSGQGIMIEVLPGTQQVFLTWFTYETAQAAKVGSGDHRWLSGLGTYADGGGSVEIDLRVTSGAFFDDPNNPPARTDAGTTGTVTLEFSSCAEGTMTYDFIDPQMSNSFTIQRLSQPPQTCLDLADQVVR